MVNFVSEMSVFTDRLQVIDYDSGIGAVTSS
jgi:hypothetical protein